MNQISLFDKKSQCCACGACRNVCPKGAIRMLEDEQGFLYPYIEEDKCVHCGLCRRTCAYQKNLNGNVPDKVYAAASNSDEILTRTASGGIFSVIADKILQDGGCVYGVSLEKDTDGLCPIHIRIDQKEELYKLQGSKYVQSNIELTFQRIKDDLIAGKRVLFSGTPCQVDGLYAYLNRKYSNLVTVDIICHGVPNARMFSDYLKFMEKRLGGTILDYKFRDKTRGQGMTSKIVYRKNGEIKEKLLPGKVTSFFGLFLKQEIYRENCYSCKYAAKERVSDITIGDYWGIYEEQGDEIKKTNMTNTKGISCVLINTETGGAVWSSIADKVDVLESEFDKVARHNEQLNRPCQYPAGRQKILNAYEKQGYEEVDRRYQQSIKIKKYYYWLENIAPKGIKRQLKMILKKR